MLATQKTLNLARHLSSLGCGIVLVASLATAGVTSTITTSEPQADGKVEIEIKSSNTGLKVKVTANILDSDTKEEKAKKIKDAINAALTAAGEPEKDIWKATVTGNVVKISQVGGGGMVVKIVKDETKEGDKWDAEPGGGNGEHGFWHWVRSWFVSSETTVVPSGEIFVLKADTPTGYWTEAVVADGIKTVAEMQADLTALAALRGYSFTSEIVSHPDGDRIELTSNGMAVLGTTTLTPGIFQVETSPGWPEYMGTMGVMLDVEDIGESFCQGDGTAMPCPCGNFGAPGRGCANSAGQGARLTANGLADVNFDSVQLMTTGLPQNVPSLFFQGNQLMNGGMGAPFGGGLLCVGGSIQRLEVAFSDNMGTSVSTIGIAAAGGMTPGAQGQYQCWYRDPQFGPCGGGFNTSNAYTILWIP